MNLASAVVLLAVVILFVMSLRFSLKHDNCSSCGNAGTCGHTSGECSHVSGKHSLYSRYKKDHPSIAEQQ